MTHKNKTTPATSPLVCNHPKNYKFTYIVRATNSHIQNGTKHFIRIMLMHFECVNILKSTQNSLVLIPYLLTYSQQSFMSVTDEHLRRWT